MRVFFSWIASTFTLTYCLCLHWTFLVPNYISLKVDFIDGYEDNAIIFAFLSAFWHSFQAGLPYVLVCSAIFVAIPKYIAQLKQKEIANYQFAAWISIGFGLVMLHGIYGPGLLWGLMSGLFAAIVGCLIDYKATKKSSDAVEEATLSETQTEPTTK